MVFHTQLKSMDPLYVFELFTTVLKINGKYAKKHYLNRGDFDQTFM